jgi:hypothetical protein
MTSLSFGPYIGDFKTEMFYFLPFINWACNIIKPENVYICTHFNREFLYKNVSEVYHVDPILTINELDQKNQCNKKVYKPKFLSIQKDFLSKIPENIENYFFEYNRYVKPCSYYQLYFKKLILDINSIYKDKILFIPDRIEKEEILLEIYEWLKNRKDVIIMGDKKTHLQSKNSLLNKNNYSEIVYSEILTCINSCKGIICPASHWTGIANLQNKNVFSWGHYISQYKYSGKYYFNNTRCHTVPKIDIKKIKLNLEQYLRSLEKC